MAPRISPTNTPLEEREARYLAREQFCQFELIAFNQRLADKKSACFGVFSPPLTQLHTALTTYLRTSSKLVSSHPNFERLESIESSLGDIFYELEDEFRASLVDKRPRYHRWSWEPKEDIAKMLFEKVHTFEELVLHGSADQSDYEKAVCLREQLDVFLQASDVLEDEPFTIFTHTQEYHSTLSVQRPLLYADDRSSVANNKMIDVANGQRLTGGLIAAVGGGIVEGNILENVGNAMLTRCPQPLIEKSPKSDPPVDAKQTPEVCRQQQRQRPFPEILGRKVPPTVGIPLVILLFIVSRAVYICFSHREI